MLRLTVGEEPRRREDLLAVEEPLELRLAGRPYVVTMRTPGHDVQLALGYLVSEGVVTRHEHVAGAIQCASDGAPNTYNVLDVTLAPGVRVPEPRRAAPMTSACGVCGTASIDDVRSRAPYSVADDPLRVDAALLATFPDTLRASQSAFDRTGGIHAAALFESATGRMLVLREDVGRHNAVDKVIGWALQEGRLPLAGTVLMVSGRASFELVQKALMAGIPMLAAVSAPSSLAVELAQESGLTLVGFLRGESMVVYAHPERVADRRGNAA